ncbi:hypothetical protein R1flu_018968 [Riccia fluitans]|uniref:Uncharacterized protein n=1 Tax=Riccia fluitans TaxID=41844 RepID=A0ABD1ZIT8_9MARC
MREGKGIIAIGNAAFTSLVTAEFILSRGRMRNSTLPVSVILESLVCSTELPRRARTGLLSKGTLLHSEAALVLNPYRGSREYPLLSNLLQKVVLMQFVVAIPIFFWYLLSAGISSLHPFCFDFCYCSVNAAQNHTFSLFLVLNALHHTSQI